MDDNDKAKIWDAIWDTIDGGMGQYVNVPGILSATDRAGYVIVPKEPTEEMIHAYWLQLGLPKEAWTAMIAAFTKEQS